MARMLLGNRLRWIALAVAAAPGIALAQTDEIQVYDGDLTHPGGINLMVHDSVARFGGSISAEHGLGQLKREEIRRYKSPLELELMCKIKRTLDPHGIMNPGKVL